MDKKNTGKKELLQKAMGVLEKSSLSPIDRAMWKRRLNVLSDDAVKLFIDLYQNDDTDFLQATTGQLRKKIKAGDNIKKINILVEEERKELLHSLQEK